MLVLMVTSKGMAGIPRVTLVVLAGVLTSFHYPLIGVAILLGIDQILDMGRTTVNLIGNCVATVVIARWEGQFNDEKMHKYLSKNKRRKQLLAYFSSKKQENLNKLKEKYNEQEGNDKQRSSSNWTIFTGNRNR